MTVRFRLTRSELGAAPGALTYLGREVATSLQPAACDDAVGTYERPLRALLTGDSRC